MSKLFDKAVVIVRNEPANSSPPRFRLGPDLNADLREHRPYFLLPFVGDNSKDDVEAVVQRIKTWVAQSVTQKGSVTDLYVLSHGWHRNFYSAVSAYDRVVSRLAILLHRGRMFSSDTESIPSAAPERYHPIFLNLHWSSDPGEDRWVDKTGRRNKASFLQNVEAVFERTGDSFTNDFEDIFQLFSRMCAAGIDALSDAQVTEMATRLTRQVAQYSLKDAPKAEAYDKSAAVWTCYHEAIPKGLLLDQDEAPGRYLGFVRAVTTFIKFIIGIVGIFAIAGALFQVLRTAGWKSLWYDWFGIKKRVEHIRGVSDITDRVSATWDVFAQQPPWYQLLLVLVSSGVVLGLSALWHLMRGKNKPANGVPMVTMAAWGVLQIAFSLPILTYCLVTYFTGWSFGWVPGLFPERIGGRNEQNPAHHKGLNVRYHLAWFARLPIRLLRVATALDSSIVGLIDGIDAQLAFWEMQRRAVEVGAEAAETITSLISTTPGLKEARLHFLGHSFGALVVVNVARHLALDTRRSAQIPAAVTVQSVTLLQAAIASNWFEQEKTLRESIRGNIACIYSRYDTANSFYYPLSNHGRLAAGFVGLSQGDLAVKPERRARIASLVRPPDLDNPAYIPAETDSLPQPPDNPRIINLDGSRLIYQGNIALGGGHDDIFKDDVVHLCWAATRLTKKPGLLPLTTSAQPLAVQTK